MWSEKFPQCVLLKLCWLQMLVVAPALAQEVFYKIHIDADGIYQLDANSWRTAGIDPTGIDPRTIRMFNNGGRELPQDLRVLRPEGLMEIAIYVAGEEDGRFDPEDHILFYGRSVHGFDYDEQRKIFEYHLHHYTNTNVYWLALGGGTPGKRMRVSEGRPIHPGAFRPASFRQLIHLEEERLNPLHAGLSWDWEVIVSGRTREFAVNMDHLDVTEQALIRVGVHGNINFTGTGNFDLLVNNASVGPFTYSYDRLQVFHAATASMLQKGTNVLALHALDNSFSLDWFEIEFNQAFVASQNQLAFTSAEISGWNEYQIHGFDTARVEIFEVSRFEEVARIVNGSIPVKQPYTITFQDTNYSAFPKQYLATTPARWLKPDGIFPAIAPRLHLSSLQADFLIITHQDFQSEARRLADHKQAHDGLRTEVVLIADIFDAFSGGVYDPVAIRDFLKFALTNWPSPPDYVLLFGDGDYDYKNVVSASDKNWIPPFELDGDYFTVRATDDWYTYLTGDDRIMDLSIGRLPVQTLAEAQIVLDKIIRYETDPAFGSWKNRAIVVADDVLGPGGQVLPFESVHTEFAELLAEESLSPRFDVQKIYLIEFPERHDSTIAGVRKPEARREIIDQINRGALLVNYTGHSNAVVWSNERVLDLEAVDEIDNGQRLPFIFSASSQFPKFDDPLRTSIPEKLLTRSNAGAIGVIGSIGIVNFSFAGNALNRAFYQELFRSEEVRIGDALRHAKTMVLGYLGSFEHIQKHHLIGDPTMRLAYPAMAAVVTSLSPSTLRGQSLVSLAGEILKNQAVQNDFEGELEIEAYGAQRPAAYAIPDGGGHITYLQPGRLLFRGKQPVRHGTFQSRFFVPADVANEPGTSGKIRLYSQNTQTDATGFKFPIAVGGLEVGGVDTTAPDLSIQIVAGNVGADTVTQAFTLQITLADSSGINLFASGQKGIFLAFGEGADVEVSRYFEYAPGSFTRGTLLYNVNGLPVGSQSIKAKAWDNFNNLAEKQIHVYVAEVKAQPPANIPHTFALHQNFPNPFNPATRIRFDLPRNTRADVQIFDLLGRKVRTLMDEFRAAGSHQIVWDGHDDDGRTIASGVYLMRMRADDFVRVVKVIKMN
ncbi:MAG: type IX secretion system sortase PorU [bacterium]